MTSPFLVSCKSIPANNYCDIVEYIVLDPADKFTPVTARQLLVHNNTVENICHKEIKLDK